MNITKEILKPIRMVSFIMKNLMGVMYMVEEY
nr:MAG TPA: hypothetical protein [Bacteriophage sp.]